MDRGDFLVPGAQFNALSRSQGWAGWCDPTLAFRCSELMAMEELWRQLAASGDIPMRHDIGPRALKSHLPHVAIYERVIVDNDRRYRVRLMGTRFAQVMGDLTGAFIDETLPPQYVERWHAALDEVLHCCMPLRFVSRSDTANKSFLVGEFFEAPLRADDGSLNLVIAAGIFTPADDWRSFLGDAASAIFA